MRLLDVKTLEFCEFFDTQTPKYGILSHCWGESEVSFQQMSPDLRQQPDIFGAGGRKILDCCDVVSKDGLTWVWVDTCCIDKKSSAELSEAINSMYRWYKNADKCYVHLADVLEMPEEGNMHQFKKSRWFTRGWTLQELLAPKTVCFYNAHWKYINDRDHLASQISVATRIDEKYVRGYGPHAWKTSVARTMSWAATRQTSRLEDRAYSLLGLFGINMPLLYGEGEKAFIRLQLEIIKQSDDESIFAWTSIRGFSGMLATSPDNFLHSGCVTVFSWLNVSRLPYTMTNKGLEFQLPTMPWKFIRPQKHITLVLNCYYDRDAETWQTRDAPNIFQRDKSAIKQSNEGYRPYWAIAICLSKNYDEWYRVDCEKLLLYPSSSVIRAHPKFSRVLKHVMIVPQDP